MTNLDRCALFFLNWELVNDLPEYALTITVNTPNCTDLIRNKGKNKELSRGNSCPPGKLLQTAGNDTECCK